MGRKMAKSEYIKSNETLAEEARTGIVKPLPPFPPTPAKKKGCGCGERAKKIEEQTGIPAWFQHVVIIGGAGWVAFTLTLFDIWLIQQLIK